MSRNDGLVRPLEVLRPRPILFQRLAGGVVPIRPVLFVATDSFDGRRPALARVLRRTQQDDAAVLDRHVRLVRDPLASRIGFGSRMPLEFPMRMIFARMGTSRANIV